jgi:ATP-dependent DNA helicase Rep
MAVSLNAQQRAAVRYLEGPLLVLAGAGSGKTRLITHKIAHLIKECGIAPPHIAAVTFTNKAAREMQSRVAALLGGNKAQGLRVSTFHSLGLNILRRETAPLGYRPNFSILDSDDGAGLIRDLLRREFSDDSQVSAVQRQISAWKNAMVDAEQAFAIADGDALKAMAAGLYGEYQRHLKSYNAVDFDDLIFLPVRLFAQHPDILDAWQNRIRYLLVDEYQDTNGGQ